MSYLLPHLRTGWAVDQAILNEEDRVVVVRFGHDYDPVCMQMDEALSKIADKVKNFCVVYLVDITEVPDFNTMYELYDPCTVMPFSEQAHQDDLVLTQCLFHVSNFKADGVDAMSPRVDGVYRSHESPRACSAQGTATTTRSTGPDEHAGSTISRDRLRGARKGRGLVLVRSLSTKYRY